MCISWSMVRTVFDERDDDESDDDCDTITFRNYDFDLVTMISCTWTSIQQQLVYIMLAEAITFLEELRRHADSLSCKCFGCSCEACCSGADVHRFRGFLLWCCVWCKLVNASCLLHRVSYSVSSSGSYSTRRIFASLSDVIREDNSHWLAYVITFILFECLSWCCELACSSWWAVLRRLL